MPKDSKKLVSHDVSKLRDLPGSYTEPTPNTSYSVGDTHGNAIVLIRYLYEAGIINIDQKAYDQLIDIYALDAETKVTKLTAKHCELFRDIVKKGFAAAHVPEGIHVRCFGDMLADRGSNDILNLIVLTELRESFPNLRGTILISNHDKALLGNYLKGMLLPGKIPSIELNPCHSLIRLKQLIDKKIIPYAEVEKMLQTAYLPALKLVDYVRTEDGGIDIMAHAPITPNMIEQAMKTFLPPEKRLDIYESVDNMAQVLDELNAVFQNGLTDKNSLMYKAIIGAPTSGNPIKAFLWTRLNDLELLEAPKKTNYNLRFRHGHDGEPGERVIHGISYIGYNSLLGKASPRHWGQAESALLTMSHIQGGTSEEKNHAINEVLAVQMEPTLIVDEYSVESGSILENIIEQENEAVVKSKKSTEKEIPENTGHSSLDAQNDLINFKCQAILRINSYINSRGSYSNTDTFDSFYTKVAEGRNLLRSTFGFFSVDVPQVNLAKQLKEEIKLMTLNNFNDVLAGIKEQENDITVRLPNSKEYLSLIKAIGSDFGDSPLKALLSSPNQNKGVL
ncbi:hypothetical protein [uncultured Legionella sp.]|uniref:hypothetical protein n=1 Tax=uncultured Legionella sp. TaxID=210934 RepID=UPI00262BCF0F|nr:hypothetical protein [uncultured Legionella sp.]